MSNETYVASKVRSNRPGWSISFRHPLRNDSKGRPGLKMRRGLGTSDEAEADALVSDMNLLLSDQAWWSASKRQEAELRFSKPIIKAFYDEIQAGRPDPEVLRETYIRLPNAEEDGYSRVLFVGTTGAGKTSLLRQLIGSDPNADRFPSTAPAKTTIADIEVIQAKDEFEAVVTFFTEFQTQANIEECVIDAALAAFEKADIEKVADRFLCHRSEKFRLSYILGSWNKSGINDERDEMSFDEADEPQVFDEGLLTDDERIANRHSLQKYLTCIGQLANAVVAKLAEELNAGTDRNDREAEKELIEENFERQLTREEAFHELVQDILEDVRSRFDFIDTGKLVRLPSGWPELWHFKSEDRTDFIRQIRWFSSNYWPQFGRLLTPLVNGIRIRGPLFSEFLENNTRIAFIDGQGLGHTPDTSASVTTHITRRFGQVNVILLVDNAQQPMQAAPLSVLRAVASSGHHKKLAIAFTHFDQIKGQSLPTVQEKRSHVMGSVRNALSNLQDVLGTSVIRAIEHDLDARCFMLGGVDRQITKLPIRAADYMKDQLSKLVRFFESAIAPSLSVDANPIYDPTGIGFAVQEAVAKFQGPWLAKLGMGTYEGFSKVHWARVKALNRRIAGELDCEYDNLQPVADLVMQLREPLSRFLNNPIGWTRSPVDELEEQSIISNIRQRVDAALHDLAVKRLIDAQLAEWRRAYDERGFNSTYRRALVIHGIYNAAVPLPDAVMTKHSGEFLAEIRKIVIFAVESSGGEVRLSQPT